MMKVHYHTLGIIIMSALLLCAEHSSQKYLKLYYLVYRPLSETALLVYQTFLDRLGLSNYSFIIFPITHSFIPFLTFEFW